VQAGQFQRPSIAVSFDDGVYNTLAAARILEEFGLTGCFFLCPSIVGEQNRERLQRFCVERLRFVPTQFLGWEDVDALLARGHEVGGHTVTHAHMASLPVEGLDDEIARCMEMLRARVGTVRHFAWPFGRFTDVTARAVDAVFQAGFETCASAERGCHTVAHRGPLRELCLRRETIVAGWPVDHSLYLMSRSIPQSDATVNEWPSMLRNPSA
jgi:peptidoglycan/xylan/chitin deacetylase (PgdA/CDA1 family)